MDATGAFCILSANLCQRRRGDADDRATTGTIGEAQQAPDGGADADGSGDVRGGDGGGFDRAPRERLSNFIVWAYGTQQTQKNTEETRGIRYQP